VFTALARFESGAPMLLLASSIGPEWCADATTAEKADGGSPGQQYDFLFVDQNGFEKHAPKTFAALAASFLEYRT